MERVGRVLADNLSVLGDRTANALLGSQLWRMDSGSQNERWLLIVPGRRTDIGRPALFRVISGGLHLELSDPFGPIDTEFFSLFKVLSLQDVTGDGLGDITYCLDAGDNGNGAVETVEFTGEIFRKVEQAQYGVEDCDFPFEVF